MSRFLTQLVRQMNPYMPGEQPQDKRYIKLNTNECPYGPSKLVTEAIKLYNAEDLKLYPDPLSLRLKSSAADFHKLESNQVFVSGGSDETLAYAFMAFSQKGDKVYFPDITYGFYKVYAELFEIEACEIPLKENLSIDVTDYFGLDGNIFIANPNAPTGICLRREDIQKILENNPDRLVVVDEAYVDFSDGKSSVDLINKYENLLVVQTFSKSRSLAGMRIGFGFAQSSLIEGLEKIKFSFNPYNIDRITTEVASASIKDCEYFEDTIKKVVETREWTRAELEKRGFCICKSESNFLFISCELFPAEEFYLKLKDRGILVRYFSKERIKNYIRMSIGTGEEMVLVMKVVDEIISELTEGTVQI